MEMLAATVAAMGAGRLQMALRRQNFGEAGTDEDATHLGWAEGSSPEGGRPGAASSTLMRRVLLSLQTESQASGVWVE